MTDEKNDSLAIPKASPFAVKKVGIAAKADEARKAFKPEERENRIIILADDSGSMSGTPIKDAKKGISQFLKSCTPVNTAVGIYSFGHKWPLTCDFLTLDLLKDSMSADYGTPIFGRLKEIVAAENLTRAVIFSDGQPTDADTYPKLNDAKFDVDTDAYSNGEEDDEDERINKPGEIIQSYIDKKIPIDTIYIGYGENKILKQISEWTGGIYLQFKDSGMFGTAFKYLAPAYRGLLKEPSFRKEIGSSE